MEEEAQLKGNLAEVEKQRELLKDELVHLQNEEKSVQIVEDK
jgi:hypothetical protein